MNAIDVINKFVFERNDFQEKIDQLFPQDNFLAPHLSDDFYRLAEKVSQINNFEHIAEALLTAESPQKIDPQAILRIWFLIAQALPKLLLEVDEDLTNHLKTQFHNLCLQNEKEKYTSSAWITNHIKNLSRGQFFHLLLPQMTLYGKSLENVVSYHKNINGTYNIRLFHAKKASWDEQGGEHAWGYEKIHPLRYFAEVPFLELMGPDNKENSSIHAQTLLKVIEDPNSAENALLDAFSPLNAYTTQPDHSERMVSVEHAHSLKSLHAFLYSCFLRGSKPDKALDSYKAFICLCRLILTMAIQKSFKEKDAEKIHTKFGFLREASLAAARYVNKQKANPFVKSLYASAIGTLEELKNQAEELQRAHIPADNSLKDRHIRNNQTELLKHSQIENKKLIEAFLKEKFEGQEVLPLELKDILKFEEVPKDHGSFNMWLNNFTAKIESFGEIHPELKIPALTSVIVKFPLPHVESIWLQMSERDRKNSLDHIRKLSELLTKTAFQQNVRFSLEVQNAGAYLLVIAHALAETLDKKYVLRDFKPALKGYHKLTTSPYFKCETYSAWQQRKELLAYTLNEIDRKGAWNFRNKAGEPFDKTLDGKLTQAILNAYPDIKNVLIGHLGMLRQHKGFEGLRTLLPGQLLLAELLDINLQSAIDCKLDRENDTIHVLSNLAQTAMYVHLLSDKWARYHVGYDNIVKFNDGLSFDLVFAKTLQKPLDFQVEGGREEARVDANQRNLLPKLKWTQNQNETLKRFSSTDDESLKEAFPFEESASEPDLFIIQLLSQLKSKLFRFEEAQAKSFMERYLFKVQVDKNGRESFPLVDEIEEYPHVFQVFLKDFLDAFPICKNAEKARYPEQIENISSICLRLYSVASALSCESLVFLLTESLGHQENIIKAYLENLELKNLSSCTANLNILLLKMLELQPDKKINWEQYFKWGIRLQEQLEQKKVVLTHATQLSWNSLRYRMGWRFLKCRKYNLAAENKFTNDETFHVLAMSYGKGQCQVIPQAVLTNPEFIKLFSDRISFWKVDPETRIITFSDPLTGNYQITNSEHFPHHLQRLIEGIWHLYMPSSHVTKNIHIPQAVMRESIWWLNPNNLNIKGFYKSHPNRIWLEGTQNQTIIFKEGPEKGLSLELEDQALTQLEVCTGAFGSHYYAYNARFLKDHITGFRDVLTFPNLRMPHGAPLVFDRIGHAFFERGNQGRQLGEYLFAPSFFNKPMKQKSTSLRLYGLQVEKNKKEALVNEKEITIILPFQRHVSDPHSPIVHAMTHEIGPATSRLNTIVVIEIKINALGFCPELPHENLFVAYLSLIGKDYHSAANFLRNIRPNHSMNDQERQILKWILESKDEAHDHSATAASIKLLAYKIWIEQALPILGGVAAKELPEDSLESLYLDYINHLSSVPTSLKLSQEMEEWVINKGFELVPPSQKNQKLWKMRKDDLSTQRKTMHILQLPNPLSKPLFEKWKEISLTDDAKFDIHPLLVDGMMRHEDHSLLPGKPYPLGAFGYHYNKLSSNEVSKKEKWELMYALETVPMQDFVRAGLKMAYRKNAIPLPKLDKKTSYENSQLVHIWFKQQIDLLPVQEIKKEVEKIEKENAPQFVEIREHGEINKDFAEKIFKAAREAKQTSPFALIYVLQASYANYALPIAPLVEMECPFNEENENDDLLFNLELEHYRKEWKKGIELREGFKSYLVPELGKVKELQNILGDYLNEIYMEKLEADILRILNRRPVDPDMQVKARLDEVVEQKIDVTIDDALKTVYLSDDIKKIEFLRSRNPFLEHDDLKSLQRCLREYLEWSITHRVLGRIKNIAEYLLNYSEKMPHDQWINDPTVQTNWQEIGELLNPYGQYADDPQNHMERLLFEHLCGFTIREEQAHIMHVLIQKILGDDPKESDFALVFQMIMGAGKTSVVLANMAKLAAKKGRAPIFLAHHSQHPSLQANLINTQFKRLNQDVIDLDFNRQDLAEVKNLKYCLDQLKNAKENGHLMLMKSNFLLILWLELIDQTKALRDQQNLDPLNFERIKGLAKILSFMRDKEQSLLFGDEIDCIFNILEEETFPSGTSAVISRSSLDLIKQTYVILATHPQISGVLRLASDDQSLVSKQKLIENVFPELCDALIQDYPPLGELISPLNYQDNRASLKDYLLGKIDVRLSEGVHAADDEQFFDSLKIQDEAERRLALKHLGFLRHLHALKYKISESSQESLRAAALLKELCHEILPITLGKSFNRHYGFSEEGKVIPYLGVDAPNQTEFGNIYVTACCYFQAALQKGVNAERLISYRDKLREASLHYSELYHCPPAESVEAQHFKTMTGLELHQEWSEKNISEALYALNQDPQHCLDFYAEFSSQFLRFHTSILSCGPIALANMLGQFIACSATLWNKDTFARKMAKSCLLQEGVEGRIMVKFAQDLAEKKSFITLIDEASPHCILNAVLMKRGIEARKRLRSLIDAAGMLKRYSNRQVAEEILKFQPLEEEIDAVVFLQKVGKKHKFCLLKRGDDHPKPLLMTSREEIEKQGINFDRVFIYYDELRSSGSDIHFKADGISAKTFNPFSTTIRTDLQADLRPRNFFYEQIVDTIIHKESLEGFVGYEAEQPEKCLNATNFFLTTLRNQVKLKKTHMLRSAIEQVRETFCSIIVNKLIDDFAEDKEEIDFEVLELLKASQWLFYKTFSDDPVALFLDLQQEVSAHQVLQQYLSFINRRFQETCSQYFKDNELQIIEESMKEIKEWACENLLWMIPNTHFNVYLENEILVENQRENQLEVNVEMQKEAQKELQKYAVRVDAPVAKFIPWEKLKDIPKSFKDFKHPNILTFRHFLKRVSYDAEYYRIFPKNLYLTDNLSLSHAMDLPVFHKAQKNAYHILLIKEENAFRTLFIDLKEAVFWRKHIAQYDLEDCWLCNLEGHSLNERKFIPQEAAKVLQRAQWWGHFFNGNVCYLRAHPSLIQEEMKNENYELKYRFLLLKTAGDPIQAKILSIDPLLAKNPQAVSVFQFNNKIEEEQWFNNEIAELNEEEINRLPFHFARFFNSAQIPLLKRQGYFTYLPPQNFEYVRPQQVQFIPNHRLQYLSLPEQVATLPAEKIYWLKGQALEYVSEKYLGRINPEELANLLPAMCEKYQQLQIDNRGLEAFARIIQPCMASVILPNCVAFIPDKCLPFLKTKKQLEYVSIDKYHLLKASQFHLLPKKYWLLLQLEDFNKYNAEDKISKKAETFIQQIQVECVNLIDPRLAKFFCEAQVRNISQPKAISYLNGTQLRWLNASLTKYLDPYQIAELSAQHRHLIETIDDPEIIKQLSNEALLQLSSEQVALINDRDTLLRLNIKFFPYLNAKQLVLLKIENSRDQELIKHINKDQLSGLDKKTLLAFLFYLNPATLKSVPYGLFSEVLELPLRIRQKLTAQQMQCYLNGLSNKNFNVSKYLKEMRVFQWQGLDRVFIASFFAKQPKMRHTVYSQKAGELSA